MPWLAVEYSGADDLYSSFLGLTEFPALIVIAADGALITQITQQNADLLVAPEAFPWTMTKKLEVYRTTRARLATTTHSTPSLAFAVERGKWEMTSVAVDRDEGP